MAKFPDSPGAERLAQIAPTFTMIPAGTRIARLYYARSQHPQAWNQFRYFGPVNSRWDHHLLSDGEPVAQERAIYYAAANANTCIAEFFQVTRRIDRVFQSPWLAIFAIESPLRLLDLTGDFATRMGASMAIHSGQRARARGWALDLYAAFPAAQGILYAASMGGGRPAFALNERALRQPLFPAHPLFHRALADDAMLDLLKSAAQRLGYALR